MSATSVTSLITTVYSADLVSQQMYSCLSQLHVYVPNLGDKRKNVLSGQRESF